MTADADDKAHDRTRTGRLWMSSVARRAGASVPDLLGASLVAVVAGLGLIARVALWLIGAALTLVVAAFVIGRVWLDSDTYYPREVCEVTQCSGRDIHSHQHARRYMPGQAMRYSGIPELQDVIAQSVTTTDGFSDSYSSMARAGYACTVRTASNWSCYRRDDAGMRTLTMSSGRLVDHRMGRSYERVNTIEYVPWCAWVMTENHNKTYCGDDDMGLQPQREWPWWLIGLADLVTGCRF